LIEENIFSTPEISDELPKISDDFDDFDDFGNEI